VIIKQNMKNMNALLYADFRYEVIVGLGVRVICYAYFKSVQQQICLI